MEEALKERDDRIEKLESTVSMLQEHVTYLKRTVDTKIEGLEQYGRRLCLRVEGVPVVKDHTSADVFKVVTEKIRESGVKVPDATIDRAHRIGKVFQDRVTKKDVQSIIVRFTTFRHRTLFYKARKKLKKNVRVKLDLTKHRYFILQEAVKLIDGKDAVDFVYADINCRLKIRFRDGNEEFFESIEDLKGILSTIPNE